MKRMQLTPSQMAGTFELVLEKALLLELFKTASFRIRLQLSLMQTLLSKPS